jgi:5-methylcytosine-specific restriction endonuclease McrA
MLSFQGRKNFWRKQMEKGSLKEITNEALFSKVRSLRGNECHVIADIIRHLAEIDERGIYRDAGFPSLFKYLTDELGYSEGSAVRRCRAVKVFRESPDSVYELLSFGKVTLSSLAEVTPVITPENQKEVLNAVVGSSRRDAQRVAAAYGAPVLSRKPSIRAKKVLVRQSSAAPGLFDPVPASEGVTEERYGFNFDVTPEVKAMFDEARALLGHHDVAVVFEKLLKNYLRKKKGPVQKKTRATQPESIPGHRKSRTAIPVAVKREVRRRDDCRCTFRAPDGKRCSERVSLQFDHRVPVAVGGGNEIENLRLLCPQHNQLEAERYFGPAFVEAHRQRCGKREVA